MNPNKSQQLVRNRYNPDYFHNRSLNLLDKVNKEEAISWYDHPCTESLREALEGDLAGLVVSMIGGAYSDPKSSSGTAQGLAKARGMAQAISDMLEHIEDIKQQKIDGESIDDQPST